jgi:hypothetical protein
MNKAWTDNFDDVLEDLASISRDTEDGDLVACAVDTAASLLQELPALKAFKSAKTLHELLALAGEPADHVRSAKDLYELTDAGHYDSGLTTAQAKLMSQLGEEVAEMLKVFAQKHSRKRRPSKKKVVAADASKRGKK